MNPRFAGIVPPLITPLCGRDTLDIAALERQLERVIAGGVAGVFALGTSGEAPSLSLRLREEVVRETCRIVGERVPVLVGVTDTCLAHSLTLARAAADHGAQAVVMTSPFYFPLAQAELETLARTLAAESPLPVVLYNIPQFARNGFAADTIRRLLDEPRIVGLKDSSGDLAYFRDLCALARARPDWTVLMGPEALLAEAIAAGGHGGVNGGALIWPEVFVELCRAARSGEQARVAVLQTQVVKLGRIYHASDHPAAVFKALKCALALLGIGDGRMAEPLAALVCDERARIRRVLEECGLLAAAG
jgi:4-hydroxy-tetrahydrodipicolinate synthase